MTSGLPGYRRSVFVDTSAFVALLDRADQWHTAAVKGFVQLEEERRSLVTSNLIVAETHRLLLQRLGTRVLTEWIASLDAINLLFESEREHRDTLDLLASAHGVRLTYTDASALVTMERVGIGMAFSFDQHFEYRGLTRFPPMPNA